MRKLVRAGVAMKDTNHTLIRRLANHRARIGFGIASVHHDWLSRFFSERQLLRKGAALLEPRRVVVMVVEATFAYRDSKLCELLQGAGIPERIEACRIMRMNPHRMPDESAVCGRDSLGCTSGAEDIFGAASRADAYYCLGSVVFRALNYRVAVAVERRVCEVRVAVDVPFDIPIFLGHCLSIQRSVGPAM